MVVWERHKQTTISRDTLAAIVFASSTHLIEVVPSGRAMDLPEDPRTRKIHELHTVAQWFSPKGNVWCAMERAESRPSAVNIDSITL